MVARLRRNRRLIARVGALALAAGAFVAVSGVPAHAQVYYNPYYSAPYSPYYTNPYYGNPYSYPYGTSCQTLSFGALSYNSCPTQPYTYDTPYSTPYTYYYYGPSIPYRSAGQRER
jgi:hypothetical protein